ncbi:hypothetical protein HPB52_021976 [Rhipicephalus sanguineus]|uniref:Uncharacterized protein n=1 Tax=Rhipicephalus sanguineus TaxID=34632 RepID=A0A9D4PPH1_RHISA|nr:hypothetical protein HPB52_021976 [Rhipicephalus sanguineus]
MDPRQHPIPPNAAAFQDGLYEMPAFFNGQLGHLQEMAWHEEPQWLPAEAPYWYNQDASAQSPHVMPEPRTAARDETQCGDSVDVRLPQQRGETKKGRQASLSSIGTLKGPPGHGSGSSSFWSQHSTPDVKNSWASSASSLSTADTSNAVSESQLITTPERQQRSKTAAFPWMTCVPMVGLTTLAALLFLFVVFIAVRSQRFMMQLPVTPYVDEGYWQNSWPRAANIGNAVVYSKGGPLEGRENLVSKVTVPELRKGAAQKADSFTMADDDMPLSVTRRVRKQDTTTSAMTMARVNNSVRHTSKRHVTRRRKKENAHNAPASREYANGDEEEDALIFPFRRPARPACGSVFYTFCERPPLEFHYRRRLNSCVQTSPVDAADICNRGGNRFASLDRCLDSCVSAELPAKECFDRPLFTRCARKCVPWAFPSGGCPANGSTVFRTAQECRKRCEDRQHGPRCQLPEVVACGPNHLKYTYFAYRHPTGRRVRCLRSSMTMLRGHRCLAGANRFHSRGSCVSSCSVRPHSLRHS